jgi:hypothetical protein
MDAPLSINDARDKALNDIKTITEKMGIKKQPKEVKEALKNDLKKAKQEVKSVNKILERLLKKKLI